MGRRKTNSLFCWWVSPKLHPHYFIITPERKPKEVKKLIRLYYRTWVVHPIKRRVAKYYIWFLQKFFGLTVIGITGSAGKTSTKEMLYSILKQRGETEKSVDNIDPTFNIPTTALRCKPSTKYLVLEMGVEFPGEMDFYLWLAKPRVGIITNVYQTHTLFFKEVQGVAKEKGKLIKNLNKEDMAVLNKDNPHVKKIGKETKVKVFWFGNKSDVQANEISITKNLQSTFKIHINNMTEKITLPILGEQFIENALAAAAASHSLGANLAEIKKGLETFTPQEHRMTPIRLKNEALLLDDSYNNNPSAAKKAIETLKKAAGKKKTIVVIGDMLELGQEEKKLHQELGRFIANSKIDHLVGVGPLSRYLVEEASKKMRKNHTWWVEKTSDTQDILKPLLENDTITLVKASRSIGLDKMIEKII